MIDWDEHVGALIRNKGRRAQWMAFVRRLYDLSVEGGPLEGYAFHGTERAKGATIARDGLNSSYARIEHPLTDWHETEATHWAKPVVAAFYAEDRIESLERQVRLSIVVARIEDLAECGDLAADAQTTDNPIVTRLDHSEEEAKAKWDASDKGWKAGWDAFGSFCCVSDVPAYNLTVLNGEDDLDALLERIAAPSMAM